MLSSPHTAPLKDRRTLSAEPARHWRQWVLANSAGELMGLGLAGALGYGLYALLLSVFGALPPLALAVIMVLAGTLEGVIVGIAQWRVLRGLFPAMPARQWVLATAVGAFIAWVLGMLPSTLMDMSAAGSAPAEPMPAGLEYLLAVLLGAVAGPILAGAQWRVLRAYVERAWLWIPAHALAWAGGMALIFLMAGTLPAAPDPFRIALTFGAAGLLAGALVGAIHGAFLVRFQARAT